MPWLAVARYGTELVGSGAHGVVLQAGRMRAAQVRSFWGAASPGDTPDADSYLPTDSVSSGQNLRFAGQKLRSSDPWRVKLGERL